MFELMAIIQQLEKSYHNPHIILFSDGSGEVKYRTDSGKEGAKTLFDFESEPDFRQKIKNYVL